MPHVASAMRRSLRRGVGDIMLNGLVGKRTISGEVDSVKNTFSSWHNCMAKAYCKWPVIAAIVIVSLIVLSIITCIARCCCCGYSCCCSCFSFLKCCDCCGDSCAGKKNKPMKHLDEPEPFGGGGFKQPYNQGYQAPAPMMGGALPVAAKPTPPQYAQFEVGRNGLAVDPTPTPLSEDALPPMPSWDSAAKKHVLTEDEKNGVELGELDPTTGQHVPLMTGAVANAPSPTISREHSPFGPRPGPGVGGTGYTGLDNEHYDQNQAAYNVNGGGYGGSPMGGPPRMGTPQMRGSPAPGQGMRRPGGPGGPGGYGPNGQNYNGQSRGYGPPSPQDPYGQNDGFAAAPVGGGRGYGRPPPQRQFSNDQYGDDQYGNRPFPGPQRTFSSDSQKPLARQYSDGPGYPQDNYLPSGPPPRGPSRGPGGPNRMASPPLQNNSGFDFGGDQQGYQSRPSPPPQQYSRPPPQAEQMSYGSSNNRPSPPHDDRGNDGYFGSTAAPSYASRSPPPQEPTYPGYKPYQPSSSQGRGREPQAWDPVHQ